jgi:hypothetical protein
VLLVLSEDLNRWVSFEVAAIRQQVSFSSDLTTSIHLAPELQRKSAVGSVPQLLLRRGPAQRLSAAIAG